MNFSVTEIYRFEGEAVPGSKATDYYFPNTHQALEESGDFWRRIESEV